MKEFYLRQENCRLLSNLHEMTFQRLSVIERIKVNRLIEKADKRADRRFNSWVKAGRVWPTE